jgi:ribonuclease HI
MTIYLPKWIRNGFRTAGPESTGIKNKDLILHLLSLLHDRGPGNGVKFKHVAAHCGEVGNEGADVSTFQALGC